MFFLLFLGRGNGDFNKEINGIKKEQKVDPKIKCNY